MHKLSFLQLVSPTVDVTEVNGPWDDLNTSGRNPGGGAECR